MRKSSGVHQQENGFKNVACTYNGTLFCNKKRTTNTYKNMGESYRWLADWKNLGAIEYTLCSFIYVKFYNRQN